MADENTKYDGRGFCYKLKTEKGIRYYYCSERVRYLCKAREKELVTGELTMAGIHRHKPPEIDGASIAEFISALKTATQSSMRRFRRIYDEVAFDHSYGAIYRPFVSIERMMQRWRRQICPPCPNDLQEYADSLNAEEWKHCIQYHAGKLTARTITIEDGGSVTVMADRELLQTISTAELLMDATFEVCPRYPKNLQLLTIMASIDGTCEPIAWAFMTKKSAAAYVAVFQQFSTWAPRIQPREIHVDFENGLTIAIQTVYPHGKIIHCFFHFLQCLRRRLQKKGKKAIEYLWKWEQGKTFYRKLMALALLPAEDIFGAFNWLNTNKTPEQAVFFADILTYVESHWLQTVRPSNFSVYQIRRRTTNPIEAYHRTLRDRIGRRPTIWEFTAGLLRILSVVHSELQSIGMAFAVRRPPESRYVVQENILQRAWNLYHDGSFDIPTFLSCANHFLHGFGKHIPIQSPAEVDYFLHARVHNINIPPQGEQMHIVQMPPDVEKLPVFHDPRDKVLLKVYLFREKTLSLCRVCRIRILQLTTVPCNHWYACQSCVDILRERTEGQRVDLSCDSCGTEIIAFRKVYVS